MVSAADTYFFFILICFVFATTSG